MSLQVEKLEKNMAKLTIEVSAEDLDKAMEKAYQKQKSRISLPGFRKGKAPRKMIESMYGKGVFMEDAVNSLVPQEYTKALGECDLEIVSQPEINVTQMEPGKALILSLIHICFQSVVCLQNTELDVFQKVPMSLWIS